MGVDVSIEAGFGAEKLINIHPDGRITGGKAVFAFLSGLSLCCDIPSKGEADSLNHVYVWYEQLDRLQQQPLCVSCRELLDCMWGDGGDSTDYREDDYAFFLHRTGSSTSVTEEQFRQMLRDSFEAWRPIDLVIAGVRKLLDLFQRGGIQELEGFFAPQDTIPDFEALLSNLEWLMKRGNDVVRLNFS
jgi:hypothetical protein